MSSIDLVYDVKEELRHLMWSIQASTEGATKEELIELLNDISDSLKECLDKLNAYY